MFLPKGFNDVVKNPLILIDVEGKGKIKYNKCEYSVPEEIERLKVSIFRSHKFVEEIQVTALSDSFALVYMLNLNSLKFIQKTYFQLMHQTHLKLNSTIIIIYQKQPFPRFTLNS